MKTCYAISSGSYSDYSVIAIFTTRELAEAELPRYEGAGIEEFPLDPTLPVQYAGLAGFYCQPVNHRTHLARCRDSDDVMPLRLAVLRAEHPAYGGDCGCVHGGGIERLRFPPPPETSTSHARHHDAPRVGAADQGAVEQPDPRITGCDRSA
jgi:hypothetical protein